MALGVGNKLVSLRSTVRRVQVNTANLRHCHMPPKSLKLLAGRMRGMQEVYSGYNDILLYRIYIERLSIAKTAGQVSGLAAIGKMRRVYCTDITVQRARKRRVYSRTTF